MKFFSISRYDRELAVLACDCCYAEISLNSYFTQGFDLLNQMLYIVLVHLYNKAVGFDTKPSVTVPKVNVAVCSIARGD